MSCIYNITISGGWDCSPGNPFGPGGGFIANPPSVTTSTGPGIAPPLPINIFDAIGYYFNPPDINQINWDEVWDKVVDYVAQGGRITNSPSLNIKKSCFGATFSFDVSISFGSRCNLQDYLIISRGLEIGMSRIQDEINRLQANPPDTNFFRLLAFIDKDIASFFGAPRGECPCGDWEWTNDDPETLLNRIKQNASSCLRRRLISLCGAGPVNCGLTRQTTQLTSVCRSNPPVTISNQCPSPGNTRCLTWSSQSCIDYDSTTGVMLDTGDVCTRYSASVAYGGWVCQRRYYKPGGC